MNSGNYLLIFAVIFLLCVIAQNKRNTLTAVSHHHMKDTNKEVFEMKALAEKFIGKDCLVYTVTSATDAIKGIITEVSESGILIESNGEVQAVNLEYVTRIREWPRNSKGKKKTVF